MNTPERHRWPSLLHHDLNAAVLRFAHAIAGRCQRPALARADYHDSLQPRPSALLAPLQDSLADVVAIASTVDRARMRGAHDIAAIIKYETGQQAGPR